MSLRVRLLGGFELLRDGSPVALSSAQQRLVALVAIPDHPLARPRAAGQLWPDVPQARAEGNLRSTLWRLRPVAPGLVEDADDRLLLAPEVAVDFKEAVALARRLVTRQAADASEITLHDLAADLLPHSDEEWIVGERERFRQLRLHALEVLTELLSDLGRHALAIDAGLTAVAAEPLRESAHRALVAAFLAEGNRSEAVAEYRSYQRLARRDLNIEPSADLHQLLADLL